MATEQDKLSERMEQHSAKVYERWLRDPTTKLLISLIPEAHPPETLTILIRQAFEFGLSVGRAQIASEIVERMVNDRKP